jgi:dihydrofolate synthase/folylpolyglutamate synthase
VSPLTFIGRDWRYTTRRTAESPAGVVRHLVILDGPDPAFIPPGTEFEIGLAGDHQLENAAVALAALEQVRRRFPHLSLDDLRAGLATVSWEGRLQLLQSGDGQPAILVDCAHNDDSAARLAEALTRDYAYQQLILVFGAPEDKNVAGMLARLAPLADEIIVTTANHPRSAAPENLSRLVAANGRTARETHTVAEGLSAALELARPGDLILITGSIIVVGDLLNHWDTLKSGHTYG